MTESFKMSPVLMRALSLSQKKKTLSVKSVSGYIVDIINKKIFKGQLTIKNGIITAVKPVNDAPNFYIIPGFIDSHVHVESSMLTPVEFASVAIKHGVIACFSDPHEIANVLGVDGVRYMINESRNLPFRFYFGAPSCVPATDLETTGGKIEAEDIENLMKNQEVGYLSEVMNYPAVIGGDKKIMEKIEIAKKYGKKIDGHAPGLRDRELLLYIKAGITTDHEVTTYDEGKEKILNGMKIQIREGSAAKNLEALAPLIKEYPQMCMLCSDDIHPDDLIKGNINLMIKQLLNWGYDPIDVLRAASFNAARHYEIDFSFLQKDDKANFLLVDDLKNFNILCTVVDGKVLQIEGHSLINFSENTNIDILNKFNAKEKSPEDFRIPAQGDLIKVIEAVDSQIYTKKLIKKPKTVDGYIVSDVSRDILKIAVINRYEDHPPAVGFVKNFGLKKGAIASSVAHDSHNIVCVGVDDSEIAKAVNLIIRSKGGLSLIFNDVEEILPLPVAGLMSERDCNFVSNKYKQLDRKAKELGSLLKAPFMTLSFMTLPVIPALKLTDRGLFDSEKFKYTSLFEDE